MGAVCLLWQSWQFLFLFFPWLAVQFRQSIPVVHAVCCPRSIMVILCLEPFSLLSCQGIRSCICYFVSRTIRISTFTLGPFFHWSVSSGRGSQYYSQLLWGSAFPFLPLISRCHSVRDPSVSSCHSTFLTAQVFFPGCTIICPVSWVVPLDDTPYPRPR